MKLNEIRRLYFIIRTFLNYGVNELFPEVFAALPLHFWFKILFSKFNCRKDQKIGERLRLALQELGPMWVKFGQMLSTRRDLFPPQIIDQLALLQDRVKPFDGLLAKKQIERAMGNIPIETWFEDFNLIPIASASIAQIHTARLRKNGKEVIIKIIRPDIFPIIKADIKLIYYLINWVLRFIPNGYRFHPIEVVREYEKTLISELNLLHEASNAIQFRRNFKNSPVLYIPEVYIDYCSRDMMVMERIHGIPISDIPKLVKDGTDMKLLADRGVQIFFTQVFRDSFFHADMHPGNIFISCENLSNPKYISIDFGIVGSLNKEDKRYLAENFIAFFNRDYRKVAELHINSGWIPLDTNVIEFEFAIRAVCEPIFQKPLAEISFSYILVNLFKIAHHFNMEIQPQLVLFQKTLFYIEGIGRQLYPQLDLWKTAKPFLESWIKDQVGLSALVRSLKEKLPFWIEKIPEIPELVYNSLYQKKNFNNEKNAFKIPYKQEIYSIYYGKSFYLFGVGTVLLLSGILLFINQSELRMIPVWLMMGGIIIWVIGWLKM